MNFKRTLVACLAGMIAQQSMAAVSPEMAAQLGKALTPIGAERAGNATGTIPAWSGEMALQSEDPVYMTDPMPEEQPLYTITSANLDQYRHLLSEGAIELFAKKPGFSMDVYPTHRTAVAPDWIHKNTADNALETALRDGVALENWKAGVPFPMPQNGSEAIWNHLVRWVGATNESVNNSYYVDSSGEIVRSSQQYVTWASPAYSPDMDWQKRSEEYLLLRADFRAPARRAGEITLVLDPSDFSEGNGRKAWQYLAGQRRVRRAPAVAFDTPAPATAGSSTYDDTYMYNGSPEKYDWKLVGKRECVMPYNNWKALNVEEPTSLLGRNFFKPEYLRWELHRCWEVEGTLKDGVRHIYKKRRYYLDEDTWSIVMGELYDGRDNLWRANFSLFAHAYQTQSFWSQATIMYDFSADMYNVSSLPVAGTWTQLKPAKSPTYFTPNALKRSGVR